MSRHCCRISKNSSKCNGPNARPTQSRMDSTADAQFHCWHEYHTEASKLLHATNNHATHCGNRYSNDERSENHDNRPSAPNTVLPSLPQRGSVSPRKNRAVKTNRGSRQLRQFQNLTKIRYHRIRELSRGCAAAYIRRQPVSARIGPLHGRAEPARGFQLAQVG